MHRPIYSSQPTKIPPTHTHTHTHALVHHPRLASNDMKRRLDLRKILHFLFDLFPIYPRLMQSNRSEPSVAQQYRETVGRASERKEMGAWVRKIEQRSGENERGSRRSGFAGETLRKLHHQGYPGRWLRALDTSTMFIRVIAVSQRVGALARENSDTSIVFLLCRAFGGKPCVTGASTS